MDTSARGAHRAAPSRPVRSPLASEMRTSAYLLGGALGSMGLLAVALLLLTHWLAG